MHFLDVQSLIKSENGRTTLSSVSFTQQQGQKIAIVGETGSGKTSVLKAVGGLLQADSGAVFFKGKRVRGPLEKLIPGHPEIAYLSQYFELRNNYRVEEELDCKNKLSPQEAERIYSVCRIGHLLKRKTNQLSGGERQRIVLAALLTTQPQLLLLDEPYSNLDPLHRDIMKEVIRDIGEHFAMSFILVSHEAADTLSWADQLLVLKEGRLIQQGTPQQVYHQPVDTYTAALLGDYNLLQTPVNGMDYYGRKLFIRPGDIRISLHQTNEPAVFGTVRSVAFRGGYYMTHVIMQHETVQVYTLHPPPPPGTLVFLSFNIPTPWFL